jgi:hypothetical protein
VAVGVSDWVLAFMVAATIAWSLEKLSAAWLMWEKYRLRKQLEDVVDSAKKQALLAKIERLGER